MPSQAAGASTSHFRRSLLAGGGAGIKLGHHVVMPEPKTPLCNLWLTLLHGIGIEAPSHGDSAGIIDTLIA